MTKSDQTPFEADPRLADLLREAAKLEALPPASAALKEAVLSKLSGAKTAVSANSKNVRPVSEPAVTPVVKPSLRSRRRWIAIALATAGCVGLGALVLQPELRREVPKALSRLTSATKTPVSNAKPSLIEKQGVDDHYIKDEIQYFPQAGASKDGSTLLATVEHESLGFAAVAPPVDSAPQVSRGLSTQSSLPQSNTPRLWVEQSPSSGPKAYYFESAGQPARPIVVDGYSIDTQGRRLAESEQRSRKRGENSAEGLAQLRLLSDDLAAVDGERVRERDRLSEFSLAEGRSNEQYAPIVENPFLTPQQAPLSTFGIDVDTASYANVRRFITSGQLPPPAAVRIEEMVNYFSYNYPQPKENQPFSVNMEVADCPWQPGHWLLRVGLKGKEVDISKRPASNLVFLVDVSGSMNEPNKLPLLKTSLSMLVGQLTENDRVTIVTYAGDAGLKLAPTSGDQKAKILAAIEGMQSGGSTNGSAGINLAYEQAAATFIKGGTNRVILATDGDLNVGVTSDEALVKLIEEKRTSGTFLTVLGFGTGNLKDGKMEGLADHGNGIYAYIDSVREARKVLVEQMAGSLLTIAKDVKLQLEFNPAQVASYRLIGYENRVMAAEDFANDKKDAGDIGSGHTVTALYELVPAALAEKEPKKPAEKPAVDPLKYQKTVEAAPIAVAPVAAPLKLTEAAATGEICTLKLRFKQPDGDKSELQEIPLNTQPAKFSAASPDFQFAAAVASWGMLLRHSQYSGSMTPSAILEIATSSQGSDPSGYRAEFLDLVRKTNEQVKQ